MSLRVMRKLMEQQQQGHLENPGDASGPRGEGDEDDEDEEPEARPAKGNFGLLWSELIQEDGDEEEEGGQDEESKAEGQQGSAKDESLGSSGKKNKKKKKSKKKQKSKCTGEADQGVATQSSRHGPETIQEAELLNGLTLSATEEAANGQGSSPAQRPGGKGGGQSSSSKDTKSNCKQFQRLISADPGLLRAEDELKKIFGAKVMREVDRQEAGGGSQRGPLPGPRGGARQGGTRRQGRAGRKLILTQPLDSWPPVDKSELSMEQVKHDGDVLRFQFKESPGYQRVSQMLEDCVESHDPNEMVNLVARHPYHVGGLLALSEVYRHMGEAQVAAELLERALYVLESVWHPYFNPCQGNCRMEFNPGASESMYLALFRNVQQLSRRGCHRAALENAKLLLSLDPEADPQGMLLCIDYFALRAEQGPWLEELVESLPNKALSLFPNYVFSLALAQYFREEAAQAGTEQSGELLRDALLLHPYVLPLIIKKAPIQVNPEWSKVLKSRPYSGSHRMSPTLEHLCAIYSERSSMLWRSTAVQKWLKETATKIAEGMIRGSETQQDAANWDCVRQEAFTDTSNQYRHLLVSDFSDNISTVPPEILMGAGGPQEGHDNAPPDAHRGPRENLEGRNPLVVFIETLLPWNDYGVEPNQQDDID